MRTLKNEKLQVGHTVFAVGLFLLVVTACNPAKPAPAGLSDQDQAALCSIAEQDSTIVKTRNWDALEA